MPTNIDFNTIERNWTPQIAWVEWAGKQRLGVKLGRERNGQVRTACLMADARVQQHTLAAGRVRAVNLAAVPLPMLQQLCDALIDAGLMRKQERLDMFRLHKRLWREAEACRLLLKPARKGADTRDHRNKPGSGPLPAAVINADDPSDKLDCRGLAVAR